MWENRQEGEFPNHILSNLNVSNFEVANKQGDIQDHAELLSPLLVFWLVQIWSSIQFGSQVLQRKEYLDTKEGKDSFLTSSDAPGTTATWLSTKVF